MSGVQLVGVGFIPGPPDREPTIEQVALSFGEHGRKALEWQRHSTGCPVCSSRRSMDDLCQVGVLLWETYNESRDALLIERR